MVNKKDLIGQPAMPEPSKLSKIDETEHSTKVSNETKTRGMGIRTKMVTLLVIIILAFAGQAYYLVSQLDFMTERFGNQEKDIIKEMAEQEIMNKANAVACQVQLYLQSHPDLAKENFIKDEIF